MFRNVNEQLRIERQKNEALAAENAKMKADLAYVAMMADVELDEEESGNE